MDLHRVEAVEEVLPEAPLRHLDAYVHVGGGDDAHVHRAGLGGSHALELPRLQHPQQLGLLRLRHVAHLVQEERARIGQLEVAHPVGLGVREGALHVAEQLALEDALREAAGVDGDQRLPGAGRQSVQPPGHHLLAGAVLAGDQHVGLGRARPGPPAGGPAAWPGSPRSSPAARPGEASGFPSPGAGSPGSRGPTPRGCAGWREDGCCPTASPRSPWRRAAWPPQPPRCSPRPS